MDPKLLRLKPMADDIDVSPRTMHYLISVGCPCIQIRRLLWFNREEVISWLSRFQRNERKRTLKAKTKELASVKR
jgi:hypothetical protein